MNFSERMQCAQDKAFYTKIQTSGYMNNVDVRLDFT